MTIASKRISPAIILTLLIGLYSLLVSFVRPAETAQPQLQTVRLTDVTQTEGMAFGPKIVADSDRIHVSWSEDTNSNEGFDLFYRQLPFGRQSIFPIMHKLKDLGLVIGRRLHRQTKIRQFSGQNIPQMQILIFFLA